MTENIRYQIDSENDYIIVGSTYDRGTFFGNWLKYKKPAGTVKSAQELEETEIARVRVYESYKLQHPEKYTPTESYYEACKKWHIKK